MTTQARRPPRLAVWLLERRVRPDERAMVLGDLNELFQQQVESNGAWHAALWFWLEAARLSWGLWWWAPGSARPFGLTTATSLSSDVRHAVRGLRAAPAYTAAALAVLALSIGATTAIFSLVDAVTLRGLPFDESERLMAIGMTAPDRERPALSSFTRRDVLDFQAGQDAFEELAAIAGQTLILANHGEPVSVRTRWVSASLFRILRVPPALGSVFGDDAEVKGNHLVAVISDQLWRQRFAADPGIVGRTLPAESGTYTIIGVMPPGFTYPVGVRAPIVGASDPVQIWLPLHGAIRESRSIIGRLRPGVTVTQARSQVTALMTRLSAERAKFRNRSAYVATLHETLVGPVRPWMLMLLGGVGFVLLIACVNVANLMLARVASRERETAIRAALGASRWRMVRAFLVESLVLSCAGTALALVVASWGLNVLRASLPPDLPRAAEIGIDVRVLSIIAATAIGTGLLVGLVPALQGSRPGLPQTLRDGAPGSTGGSRALLRPALVVAEVSLAVALLVGAGLFLSSFARLVRIDIGIDYRDVLSVTVLPRVDDPRNPDARQAARARAAAAFPAIIDRVSGLPGVTDVGFINGGLPLTGRWTRSPVRAPGREAPLDGDDAVDLRRITPGYGRVLGVEVVRGRYLTATDLAAGNTVAVINEEAASRYFGDRNPLGATLGLDADPLPPREPTDQYRVVGIVKDVRLGGPETAVRPEAYIPGFSEFGGDLVVRTAGGPAYVIDGVKRAVWAEYPGLPITEAITMEDRFGGLIVQRQFNMLIVGLFGLLGVLIAAFGIYGVTAYLVTQRTREIGVRMALGAEARQVLRTILEQVAVLLGLGLACGFGLAWWLARFVESFLFEVRPHDLAVYAGVAVTLFLCGIVAAVAPAKRAARVDPLIALRE